MMTGSRSSQKKPSTESRSLYAGHHLHSIRNALANCSRGPRTPPVLISILRITTRQHEFAVTRLSIPYLLTLKVNFSSTLTTCTLNTRSLRWFEAGFRQQTSVDLPPSSNELIHKYRSIYDAAYSCACGTLRGLLSVHSCYCLYTRWIA